MSSISINRILSDIKKLHQHPLDKEGIYWHFNEDDIYKFYAMIIGPKNTPYQDGFYFFEFLIPETYPMDPPKVIYHTQFNNIRFNPNLYTNGKVCLSIINTWEGPSWTPCNTLSSVLISLLGMVFIDQPLKNEPGFEHSPERKLDSYNAIVEYGSMMGATIYMLNNVPEKFRVFKKIMDNYFVSHYQCYIDTYRAISKKRQRKKYYCEAYDMRLETTYQEVYNSLVETYEKITGEKPFILDEINKIKITELRMIAGRNGINIKTEENKLKLKKDLYNEIKEKLKNK